MRTNAIGADPTETSAIAAPDLIRLQASWEVRVPDSGEGVLLCSMTTGQALRMRGRREMLTCLFRHLSHGIDAASLATVLNLGRQEADQVSVLVESLLERGIALRGAAPLRDHSDTDHMYDRQIRFFENYETDGVSGAAINERLQDSRVVLFGLGGYGVWLAMQLHRVGVREILGVDDDVVEMSNLHRQFIYQPGDIGRPKAEVCAQALNALGGPSRFVPLIEKATDPVQCADIVRGADIVINAFGYGLADEDHEHPRAFYTIANGCERAGTPSITFGGSWHGPLRIPGTDGACAGCMAEHEIFLSRLRFQPRPVFRSPAPSIAARLGINASIAVWETVRHLSGIGSLLYSKALTLDTMSYSGMWLQPLLVSPSCKVCHEHRAG